MSGFFDDGPELFDRLEPAPRLFLKAAKDDQVEIIDHVDHFSADLLDVEAFVAEIIFVGGRK